MFDALAARMAARRRGSGPRLLALVFAAAVAVTAVLGLDATVVLLTPAAFAAAAKARLPGRPHVYACTHLANSASLLLPISNLTNLLAFRATELSFARFAAMMALARARSAIAIEWAVLRRVFRARRSKRAGRTPTTPPPPLPTRPARGPRVHARRLRRGGPARARRGLAGRRGRAPGGRAGLIVRPRLRARSTSRCSGFVLGLGLIVRALADAGLGDVVADVLPRAPACSRCSARPLLAARARQPPQQPPRAARCCCPPRPPPGPTTVLAVLIGVNAGPNLTYTGSLATLLWRRVLRERDARAEPPRVPRARRGHRPADPDRRYRRAVARDVRAPRLDHRGRLGGVRRRRRRRCDATEVTLIYVDQRRPSRAARAPPRGGHGAHDRARGRGRAGAARGRRGAARPTARTASSRSGQPRSVVYARPRADIRRRSSSHVTDVTLVRTRSGIVNALGRSTTPRARWCWPGPWARPTDDGHPP